MDEWIGSRLFLKELTACRSVGRGQCATEQRCRWGLGAWRRHQAQQETYLLFGLKGEKEFASKTSRAFRNLGRWGWLKQGWWRQG